MTVTKYVQHRVLCRRAFGLLRRLLGSGQVTKSVHQLPAALLSVAAAAARHGVYGCVRAGEYLVGHRDVVELRGVTDDLLSLINPVVGVQPHHRLRQQPAVNQSVGVSNKLVGLLKTTKASDNDKSQLTGTTVSRQRNN